MNTTTPSTPHSASHGTSTVSAPSMASRVRVLSVTHVRPTQTSNSNPPPNNNDDDHHHHRHAIKLSLFDTMFLPLQPMQRLFFYGDGADSLPPFPALLSTLRSSLATTLAVFTPLAGSLSVSPSGDDVVIDCSSSQGDVRFVEAEYAGTAADMRGLAGAADHDAEAYAQLAPALDVGTLPVPALAVQVTRPAGDEDDDGGRVGAVVVGVSMCHGVADGQSLWEFVRAWTAAARAGGGASPDLLPGFSPPVFDRAAINGHPKAEAMARAFQRIFAPALPTVNANPEPDRTLQARRTYLLSASQIRSLKQRISQQQSHRHGNNLAAAAAAADSNNSPSTIPNPPSTYAAVASLIWTSGIRAKTTALQSRAAAAGTATAADDDAYLLFAADCRSRLRPPIPSTFFGNCVKLCYARSTLGELIRNDSDDDGALASAAAAVRAAVREQLEEDPLGDVDRWLQRYGEVVPQGRFVQIGSSHRFAAYETDFGWGRPSRVELAAVFVREFVAVVSAPDGGVQVSVALDRGRLDVFEANFLSLLQGSPLT